LIHLGLEAPPNLFLLKTQSLGLNRTHGSEQSNGQPGGICFLEIIEKVVLAWPGRAFNSHAMA
jgi:hypothetical protein